jgi:tyrosine-protein kinase
MAISEDPGRRISLLRIAQRRGWVVLLLSLICAAVAYGVARGQQKTYTAGALLLFQQQPLGQEFLGYTPSPIASDAGVAEATNVELASAPGIVRATAERLRLSPKAVADAISVAPVGTSQVVGITATASRPAEAADLANTYAATVVDTRRAAQQELVAQAAQRVRTQLDALERSSASDAQVTQLRTRLDQLRLLGAVQTGDVQVADRAAAPTAPSGPRLRRDTAFGILIGALLGLLAVVLLEQHDRRLRDESDLAALYGLPVLARIPQVKFPAVQTVARGRQPDPALAEAHFLLRAHLRYFDADRRLQAFLITSALPQEGKSTVAWNLAQAAAVLSPEERVLLIEADMRRPTLTAIAGLDPGAGLAEALSQLVPWREAVQSVDLGAAGGGALDVLPAGAMPPNPAQLAESKRMGDLLAEARLEYGVIVVDAPPPLVVSDALALLRHVDGVVVVGRLNHAMRDAVRRLRATLTELDAPLLGLVVNGLDRGEQSYGYGSYAPPPAARAKPSPSASS